MVNTKEIITIQKIRSQYTEKTQNQTKLEELKALDKKVKTKPRVFGYVYGTIGALVLGTGMCFAMNIIGSLMPLGIVIGLLGIAMVSTTYCLYANMLKAERKKYSSEILSLSDELLNKKEGE